MGLVESVKHVALTEDPTPTFYGPIPQIPKDVVPFLATNFSLVVRSGIAPEALADAIRRELRAIDPDVAVSSVKPMRDSLAASIAPRSSTSSCFSLWPRPHCCSPPADSMA